MLRSIFLCFSYPKQFILTNYEKNYLLLIKRNRSVLYSLEKASKNNIFRIIQVILNDTKNFMNKANHDKAKI